MRQAPQPADSPVGAFDECVALAGLAWNFPTSCAWAARVYVNDRWGAAGGGTHNCRGPFVADWVAMLQFCRPTSWAPRPTGVLGVILCSLQGRVQPRHLVGWPAQPAGQLQDPAAAGARQGRGQQRRKQRQQQQAHARPRQLVGPASLAQRPRRRRARCHRHWRWQCHSSGGTVQQRACQRQWRWQQAPPAPAARPCHACVPHRDAAAGTRLGAQDPHVPAQL